MESLPDAGSGSLVFDVTLLEPELLQEGNALKSTIRALESLVLHPSCNTERLLVDLMAQPNRFEFVFASVLR